MTKVEGGGGLLRSISAWRHKVRLRVVAPHSSDAEPMEMGWACVCGCGCNVGEAAADLHGEAERTGRRGGPVLMGRGTWQWRTRVAQPWGC